MKPTRPTSPADPTTKAASLRRALLADERAVDDARRLSRLIVGGATITDPAVVAVADRLRLHVEQLMGGR